MATDTYLFQYGSNMSRSRLADQIRRCARLHAPAGVSLETRLLGPAQLPDWRFAVDLYSERNDCRVSNIVRADGTAVWGALYRLPEELVLRSDGKRSVLDCIEGHRTTTDPANYEPIEVAVQVGEAEQVAWTYVGLESARQRCANDFADAVVSDSYRHAILDGATEIGLPADYITDLEQILSPTPDELAVD